VGGWVGSTIHERMYMNAGCIHRARLNVERRSLPPRLLLQTFLVFLALVFLSFRYFSKKYRLLKELKENTAPFTLTHPQNPHYSHSLRPPHPQPQEPQRQVNFLPRSTESLKIPLSTHKLISLTPEALPRNCVISREPPEVCSFLQKTHRQ
jgi:hypothetical protein